ncbi:hypothetical protein ACA910_008510 [Epithemia clementina (nom. ined.)]
MRTSKGSHDLNSTKQLLGLEGADFTIPPEIAAALNIEQGPRGQDNDDDDSYDEQQELASLVVASVKQNRRRQTQSQAQTALQKPPSSEPSLVRIIFGSRRSLRLMGVIALSFFVFYCMIPSSSKNKNKKSGNVQVKKVHLHYQCPAKDSLVNNNLPGDDEILKGIHENNLDVWLKTFRHRDFDDWGHTYNQVKDYMSNWKSTRFAPFLRKNSTLYDVTSGVGLDSFMTLEILKEKNGISGLTIFGNDMNENNIALTDFVLQKLLPSVQGEQGKFCHADSTRLHDFIEADTFDLVFASRMHPLVNPLEFQGDRAEIERQYHSLCSVASSREQKQLLDRYQLRQDEWYLKWTKEMIRIAKPGAPVILEQVSLPLCQNRFDFGGVLPLFWNSTPAITSLVEVSSIRLTPDKLVQPRYHVFMLKKNKLMSQTGSP